MAQFIRNTAEFSPTRIIRIKGTKTIENYTVYIIEVSLGTVKWTVSHRYSEFYELHEKLVPVCKLEKSLLPPKKLFGNQSETFIKKRQGDLEVYLQTVIQHATELPADLISFLLFTKYEIHGITQSLAEELFHKGDLILAAGEVFYVTPLQLHSITARLKLPEPTCECGDAKKDLGHVLDFITRVTSVKIVGQDEAIGSSNIRMHNLTYELLSLKSVHSLELLFCNLENITGADHIKKSLKKLKVHKSMKAIKDVLLLDVAFGQWLGLDSESVLVPIWASLTTADFTNNSITTIDESVKVMPHVEYLDLSRNQLTDVQHLQDMTALKHINLSYNCITSLNALHTKLGNIKVLALVGNRLESLQGFSKLYSLESLDVSNNEISQVLEVRHVQALPCLESLTLANNPITIVLDYRTKVLELFGDRAKEVCLDLQLPTQKELDTVAILLAIHKSKEARDRGRRHHSKKPAKDAPIAEPSPAGAAVVDPSVTSEGLYPPADVLPSASASSLGPIPGSRSALGTLSPSALVSQRVHGNFKYEMESIREHGGATWLVLLNEILPASPTSPPSLAAPTLSRTLLHAHSPGGSTRSLLSSLHHCYTGSYSSTIQHTASLAVGRISPPPPPRLGYQFSLDLSEPVDPTSGGFILPETMPSRNDTNFVTHLQTLVPDTHHLSHVSRLRKENREERPVHLVWCSSIGYTDPHREIPVAIYITTENVHIFEVVQLRNELGLPELMHTYCIPLVNLQQIVLGFQSQYVRLEEAFVGPQGTITLLFGSTNKTDLFLDSLKLAYRRAIPDLDQYEDPQITINNQTDPSLRQTMNRIEGLDSAADVNIMLYMLACAVDFTHASKPHVTHTLVITSKYLYLLREDYIRYPQPTFSIGPSNKDQFEIACAFPIMGRITGIQMYDSDTYSPDVDSSIKQTFNSTNTSAMTVPHFIGFGVMLTFDMGSQGHQCLDIRVSTSGMRDKFLATLTQVRREVSERSPSPPKIKGHGRRMKVMEPDADSLSTSSGGSGRLMHKVRPRHVRRSARAMVNKEPSAKSKEVSTMTSKTDTKKSFMGPRSAEYRSSQQKLPRHSTPYKESHDTSDENREDSPDLARRDSPTGESSSTFESASDGGQDLVENIGEQEPKPPVEQSMPNPLIVDDTRRDIPEIRKTPAACPPHSLDIMYPTMSLLTRLTEANETLLLLAPLSAQMRHLAAMMGDELLNFFHRTVAQIGAESEELRHIMWAPVTAFTAPMDEIPTCVMVSTRAVYFVSDHTPAANKNPMSPWKKCHLRVKSDSYQVTGQSEFTGPQVKEQHHSAGIIHGHKPEQYRMLRAYHVLLLKDLKQVTLGLFDTSVRLQGDTPDSIHSCVTRDAGITERFIKELMSVLTLVNPTPSPEFYGGEAGQDFYHQFVQYNRSSSNEFRHPSKVMFHYTSEECMSDLTCLILSRLPKGQKVMEGKVNLILYLLVHQLEHIPKAEADVDMSKLKHRSLILTDLNLALAIEDHVSYPIPEFCRGPPQHPRSEITDVHMIENLKCVECLEGEYPAIVLVFVVEHGLVVDTSVEHYGKASPGKTDRERTSPEAAWTLFFQSPRDRDRLLKLLTQRWAELRPGSDFPSATSSQLPV